MLVKVAFQNDINLFGTMKFSIKLPRIKSGWSIVYIDVSQVISQKYWFSFSRDLIDFVLANSPDPSEMSHYALVLHCFPKYMLRSFQSKKGFRNRIFLTYIIC